jgi:DNA-directed RNA polymerase specialized sigma24 family protein
VRSPDGVRSGSRRWPGCTRYYCASRSGSPGGAGRGARITGPELEDLAYQAAADALVAITGKLGQFRGDSRFTTWAYKFVIFEVSDKIGRHFWRNPGMRLETEDWDPLPDRFGFEAAREAEWRDPLAALRPAANTELSPAASGVRRPRGPRRSPWMPWSSNSAPAAARSTRRCSTRGVTCAPPRPRTAIWTTTLRGAGRCPGSRPDGIHRGGKTPACGDA